MLLQAEDNIQSMLFKAGIVLPNINNRVLDFSKIDLKYLKPVIYHDVTDVTQATRKLQSELAMSLLLIADEIQAKGLKYDETDIAKINETFRNHIQRAYQLGIAYVNNIFSTKGFITETDLKIIKFLTDYYVQMFINNVDKMLADPKIMLNLDRNILDIQEGRFEKSNIFNYLAHATGAIFQALQMGTVIKTLTLFYNNSVPKIGDFASIDRIPTLEFIWSTSRSEKVCPVCSGLSGQTWDATTWQEMPLIPHGSHPFCKCRILLRAA